MKKIYGYAMTETLYRISNFAEAQAAIEFFNGFHDGFIKQLVLNSQDEFEARGVHVCSGWLDLELTIAHYNYQRDTRAHDQLILAKFYKIKDLAVDFTGQAGEWPIIGFSIREEERGDELGRKENCFQAVFSYSHLTGDRQWVLRDDLKFTFSYAELKEL